MLMLSREEGMSIMIGAPLASYVVTVQKIVNQQKMVAIRIIQTETEHAGQLHSRIVEARHSVPVAISDTIQLTIVDIRGEKARIGIEAPKEYAVHRLEVYEAILKETRRKDDDDNGSTGSRVPRPSSPRPPLLDVRLDEPRESEE